jgi:hypothetical protein
MAEAIDSAATVGKKLTPLEVLLAYMNNPETSDRVRIECARAAAPFCHPRLNAIEQVATTETHEQRLEKLRALMLDD